MESTTGDGDRRYRLLLTALLTVIAGVGLTDILLDLAESPSVFHIAMEAVLLLGCLAAIAHIWASWRRAQTSLTSALETLDADRSDRDAWRSRGQKLLRGLGEEIDAQLGRWHLTPAERETALFLLKGYCHREIAVLLGKSERTVRQQAVSVYRKSNLTGRAQLSAFFLEDLLLPSVETQASAREPGEESGRDRGERRLSSRANGPG